MPSRPDLPGLLGKDGGPPPPAAITGPWAPPTLSISPPVRVALGVRPERRPGLPQVPHSSPPALTPAPGRPPRDGALRPEVAGDACTQTTLPAAGPPHGSAHTPHTCAHPALSTRRRGAAETLRPTACICLVSPGAEAVFLAGPGGLAGGRWCVAPDPEKSLGDRETVRALLWEESLHLQRVSTPGRDTLTGWARGCLGLLHTPAPDLQPVRVQGRAGVATLWGGLLPPRTSRALGVMATLPGGSPKSWSGTAARIPQATSAGGPAPASHTWTPGDLITELTHPRGAGH